MSIHEAIDIDRLLDDIDGGRGARDTIVIPVPTPTTRAIPQVRSTVRDVVAPAMRPADPAELQLICSELVSNAVLHGDAPVRLILHEGADLIVVAVHDGGSADPVMGTGPTDGLRIIDELTHGAWGISRRRPGKWVWAALPRATPTERAH